MPVVVAGRPARTRIRTDIHTRSHTRGPDRPTGGDAWTLLSRIGLTSGDSPNGDDGEERDAAGRA